MGKGKETRPVLRWVVNIWKKKHFSKMIAKGMSIFP